MCGIAGEFVTHGGRQLAARELFGMIDVLAHRGPEGAGYWLDDERSVMLMHARLSLVDLARGRQPLADETGQLWLSLNGELYGHRQARALLKQKGHNLRSDCDAEILPHLFQDHGVECFEKLRGEFAFALVDQSRRELFLVRDRFGIKPLFYTFTEDSVVFGSEIKSLLNHPSVRAELDRRHLRQSLLTLGLPDQTWLQGIRQVKPGHFLRINRQTSEELPYWTLQFKRLNEFRSTGEAADRFRSLLDEAVRLRLDADVEIGSYLSGGLDSSTIAESMVRQAPYPIKTFSIRFSDDAQDEGGIAAQTAANLGAQNIQVPISDAALADSFIPSIWHAEQVVANSHVTAKYLLSAEAGRHVKAVMTGEGSDELFAGYGLFTHQSLIEARRAGQNCGVEMRSLLRSSAMTPGFVPLNDYRSYDLVTGLYGQYPYQALRALATNTVLRRFLTREFVAEMSVRQALSEHARWIAPNGMQDLEATRASQYAWIRSELPAYLLTSLGDRPEMANSVEGRVPFLDSKLADFALGLPMSWLVSQKNGKLLIRNAMNDILPKAVTRPAKKIFWSPARKESALLQSAACADYLTRAVTKDVGVFDPGRLSAARAMVRIIPASTKLGGALHSLLITAAAIHILSDLFVTGFRSNARCKDNSKRRWTRRDLSSQQAERV